MQVIVIFFKSHYVETVMQIRQSTFARLLQNAFSIFSQITFKDKAQRENVEKCIRSLYQRAKKIGIAIPVDLDSRFDMLFSDKELNLNPPNRATNFVVSQGSRIKRTPLAKDGKNAANKAVNLTVFIIDRLQVKLSLNFRFSAVKLCYSRNCFTKCLTMLKYPTFKCFLTITKWLNYFG